MKQNDSGKASQTS